jgi:sulfite reductase beta subunit-like hemoprotein
MVRIRIDAPTVLSPQLEVLARLSCQHGNGFVHVTTGRHLQLDEVRIESVPDVLKGLREAGLFARGGGKDTVCDVTVCPRGGFCPRERFNVAPYALAVETYLWACDSSCNLPRACQIAFSGCPSDCALAGVADLGFFAQRREDVSGFSVHVGGGLDPHPVVGVPVEAFVGDDEVFAVAEAVRRLFDKYGDRADQLKAPLRRVVERLGSDEFVRRYQEERARIVAEGVDCNVLKVTGPARREEAESLEAIVPDSPASDVWPERREGFYTLRVRLPGGDVSADDVVKAARIAQRYGIGAVHATEQQDLLIPSVSHPHLEAARHALQNLDSSA